jgi:hypothetical protein
MTSRCFPPCLCELARVRLNLSRVRLNVVMNKCSDALGASFAYVWKLGLDFGRPALKRHASIIGHCGNLRSSVDDATDALLVKPLCWCALAAG